MRGPVLFSVPTKLRLYGKARGLLREARDGYRHLQSEAPRSAANKMVSGVHYRAYRSRGLHRRSYATYMANMSELRLRQRRWFDFYKVALNRWGMRLKRPVKRELRKKIDDAKLKATLPQLYGAVVNMQEVLSAAEQQRSYTLAGLGDAQEDLAFGIRKLYNSTLYTALRSKYEDYLFKVAYTALVDLSEEATAAHAVATEAATAPARVGSTTLLLDKSDRYFASYKEFYFIDDELVRPSRYFMIRFKPGYIRFFIDLRGAYSAANRLRLHTQRRLTLHATKYKSLSNAEQLALAAMNLETLLSAARIAPTLEEADRLIRNGGVFINGRQCVNSKAVLQPHDIALIRPELSMYVRVRWAFYKRVELLRELSEGAANELTSTQEEFAEGFRRVTRKLAKQHSPKSRNFITQAYLALNDVPAFIEIDYSALAFVVIEKPSKIGDFNYVWLRKSAVTYGKMLNWKYIT